MQCVSLARFNFFRKIRFLPLGFIGSDAPRYISDLNRLLAIVAREGAAGEKQKIMGEVGRGYAPGPMTDDGVGGAGTPLFTHYSVTPWGAKTNQHRAG